MNFTLPRLSFLANICLCEPHPRNFKGRSMSSEIIIASISVISVVIGAILGFWLSLKRDGIHRKRRVLHLLHVAREEARMNEQLMRYNPLNRLKKHDEMEYFLHPYLPQCDYCSSLLESSDLLGFISESDINLLIAYGRFVEKAKHCWKQYETLLLRKSYNPYYAHIQHQSQKRNY